MHEDHARQIFEIDLVNDAGVGRDDGQIAESCLAPAQERIAFFIALEFQFSALMSNALRVPNSSTCTEWSMTSSAGCRGLIRLGSPRSRFMASRMAARSTTPERR